MSISIDYAENDCPLCLLPLESYDHSHPLQCRSRHCRFNCCVDCLERLIKSTKDDNVEASDGNTFRVCLHCPNCRSNLGATIRDTLLLRKVEKYSHRVYRNGKVVVDEKLSASELEFKYALKGDRSLASAIEGAQNREDDFFGWSLGMCASSFETGVSGRSFMEDLEEVVDEAKRFENVHPDKTLLCGLDSFMTGQEQKFMTAQLTSGDTTRLAAATEMMHYVSALSRQGIKPNSIRQNKCMLESIKEIVREGNEARKLQEETGPATPSQLKTDTEKRIRAVGGMAVLRKNQNQKKHLDTKTRTQKMEYAETKKQLEYMKLHPLPLRMPKYAEVTVTKAASVCLTFLDDKWDGTVSDAFSKITVTKSFLGNITITKQHAESSGISRVIEAGSPESDGRGQFDSEKPRVIIASINRDLGQQGIVKGDVVSHFNGEPFTGTASELKKLISNSYEGEVLTFAFNADSAVAEALKRRSALVRAPGSEKNLRKKPSRKPVWARLRRGSTGRNIALRNN